MLENKTNEANRIKNLIDKNRLPQHICIIMDGNGRWAKKRNMPRTFGHQEAMERVKEIVEAATNIGIKYLTLYAFSTENWKRPKDEVDNLMKILIKYLRSELDKMCKNHIKFNPIGDIEGLPKVVVSEIKKTVEKTKDNSKMVLNIALNYGGRDEIIYGIKGLLNDINLGKISIDEINSEMFSDYLYTKGQPDPDLLIRSSGELRISNFMLYQIAYTEFWFSNIYWPDFTEKNFYEAILDYQKRDRRYGGI